MIYVTVPKDLSKMKTKLIFNLTKRQIICFSIAIIMGLPTYFGTREIFGNEITTLLMIAIMTPMFLVGVYEKDGMPLEKYIYYIVRQQILTPTVRVYETNNIYERLSEEYEIQKEVLMLEEKQRRYKKAKNR